MAAISGVCCVGYYYETCACVSRIVYPISSSSSLSSSFASLTRLLGYIKDNYSSIDCHGGAGAVFPVTVVGFELQHTGDLKLKVQ